MKRVALRGLLARKLRSTLTAIAIVLGVAMVSGTLVLTDTIDKAFDSIFSSSYEQTDAVVSGKKLVEWSQTGKAQISEDVLTKVRALPEVEAAAGTILDLSGRHEPGEDPRPGGQGDPGQQPDLRARRRARGRALQPLQARRGRLGLRPGSRS